MIYDLWRWGVRRGKGRVDYGIDRWRVRRKPGKLLRLVYSHVIGYALESLIIFYDLAVQSLVLVQAFKGINIVWYIHTMVLYHRRYCNRAVIKEVQCKDITLHGKITRTRTWQLLALLHYHMSASPYLSNVLSEEACMDDTNPNYFYLGMSSRDT